MRALIRTDQEGNLVWEVTHGDPANEVSAHSVVTSNGGIATATRALTIESLFPLLLVTLWISIVTKMLWSSVT